MTTEIKFPPAPEPIGHLLQTGHGYRFNPGGSNPAPDFFWPQGGGRPAWKSVVTLDQLHAYWAEHAGPIIEQRDGLLAKLEQAKALLREMESDLDFYGRYILRSKKDNSCHVLTPIDHDCGDRARAAIAKAEAKAAQDLPAILQPQAPL